MNSTELRCLRASYIASDVDSRVVVGAKRRRVRGEGGRKKTERALGLVDPRGGGSAGQRQR